MVAGPRPIWCRELRTTVLGGASPDPAEDAATRTLATETLVATRKQMIV